MTTTRQRKAAPLKAQHQYSVGMKARFNYANAPMIGEIIAATTYSTLILHPLDGFVIRALPCYSIKHRSGTFLAVRETDIIEAGDRLSTGKRGGFMPVETGKRPFTELFNYFEGGFYRLKQAYSYPHVQITVGRAAATQTHGYKYEIVYEYGGRRIVEQGVFSRTEALNHVLKMRYNMTLLEELGVQVDYPFQYGDKVKARIAEGVYDGVVTDFTLETVWVKLNRGKSIVPVPISDIL